MKWLVFAAFLTVFLACDSRNNSDSPKTATSLKPEYFFTDVTETSGIKFVHDPGVDGSYFMPESMGTGGAFLDFDNDGDLDIYLINSGPHNNTPRTVQNHLYRNDGNKFTDVTASSGLKGDGYGIGVAVGDIDNDGDVDIYVTNYGPDELYRNNGNGSFSDITREARIRDHEWGSSAAFFDYNNDGFLDLYVANYLKYDPRVTCTDTAGRQDYCGPKGFRGAADILYRNNRNRTFTDVSSSSGIASVEMKGLGVAPGDFNRDGLIDIFVANDGEPNLLWVNRGNGTFQDQAHQLGAAVNAIGRAEANMGIAVGDVGNDGGFDLFVTHLRGESNTLFRFNPEFGFQDDTVVAGLSESSIPYTGFGTGFFDFDQDGDLDLAVANGRISRGPLLTRTQNYWDDYAEPNLLYQNDGNGKFTLIQKAADFFSSTIETGRGLAFGDFDNDGDIDLLVTNCGQRARLYRNDLSNKGHWLMVRATNPVLKLDGIGAEITITVAGKKIMRHLSPAYSYLCSNDPRVHFGLGPVTDVEQIQVRWPDGGKEDFSRTAADRLVVLEKGKGKSAL